MTIIQRYFLKIFFRNFIIIQSFIYFIYMFFLFFSHSKYISRFNASFIDILIYDTIKSPIFIYQTIPVAFIVSVVTTFIILIKNNELTAFLSIGGDIFTFVKTLMIIGILFSIFIIFMSDYIVPKVQKKGEDYKISHIEKKQNEKLTTVTNLWFKDNDSFIKIGTVDIIGKNLYDIQKIRIDRYGKISSIEYIDQATYKDKNIWNYNRLKIINLSDIPRLESKIDNLTLQNDTFTKLINYSISTSPKQLTMKELRKLIRFYKGKGLNYSSYSLYYYNKISYSIIILVLTVVLLPYTIDIARSFSYIKIAANSIVIIFGFWIFMSACLSLGKSGVLNPILSNFLPHIIFIIIGFYGYYKKRNLFYINK
ncbi:MAG: LptF/LptG family permease [Calditerrivibrio sp.]|nr:LptF/LptG family permease [Calditerrivibrio sp.]